MRALAVCPTRGRPERAEEMIRSFIDTRQGIIDIVFYIDLDDHLLGSYIDLFHIFKVYFKIVDRITTTQMFNRAIIDFPNYNAYHMTNDDFIYQTKGWDVMFADMLQSKGHGIVYGNDLVQRQQLCTAPMISAQIIRALGWLQLPTLTHLCGDVVWREIGKALGFLYYLPDVIIEHKHMHQNKLLMDDTYKNTNSREMYERDWEALKQWKTNQMDRDVSRIGDVLSAEG